MGRIKRLTIFSRSVIILLVIFSPIISILIIYFQIGNNIIYDDIKKSLNQRVEFSSSKLSFEFEKIETQLNQMMVSSDFLMLNVFSQIKSETDKIQLYNNVLEKLQIIKVDTSELIIETGVYYTENKMLVSTKNESDFTSNQGKFSIEEFISNNTAHLSTFMYIKETDSFYVFSFNAVAGQNSKYLTMICYAELSKNNLEAFINKIGSIDKSEGIVLLDDNNKWSVGDMSFLKEKNIQLYSLNETNVVDHNYLISFASIDSINSKIYLYSSTKNIMQALNRYVLFGTIIEIFIIGGVIIYVLLLLRTINKPIKYLVKAFKKIDVNNLEEKFEETTQDEFSELYNSYNKMIDRLRINIKLLYEQKILTQKAELMYLQEQINPHFLYNSLYSISRMAKSANNQNIYDFSFKLSNYYRYLAKSNNDEIYFEIEYSNAINYIDIQSVRYGNRIKVNIDEISEQMKKFMVLKFILQPIIENAYEHGHKNTLKDGIIEIKSLYEQNVLRIIIEDNGNELNDEKLEIMQERLCERTHVTEDIGIYNVNKRLQIKYGESSGLHITRSNLGGLSVEIIINYN